MAIPAARNPRPLVTLVRNRTVARVYSMGLAIACHARRQSHHHGGGSSGGGSLRAPGAGLFCLLAFDYGRRPAACKATACAALRALLARRILRPDPCTPRH